MQKSIHSRKLETNRHTEKEMPKLQKRKTILGSKRQGGLRKMAKEDEERTKFIGQKVTEIREATQEEHESIIQEDEEETKEPLMVAILENGCKLYLLSDVVHETRTGSDELDEGTEVAIAETENGDIIEIPQ